MGTPGSSGVPERPHRPATTPGQQLTATSLQPPQPGPRWLPAPAPSAPSPQLHAACLASVAAALVRLPPSNWVDQGLLGLLGLPRSVWDVPGQAGGGGLRPCFSAGETEVDNRQALGVDPVVSRGGNSAAAAPNGALTVVAALPAPARAFDGSCAAGSAPGKPHACDGLSSSTARSKEDVAGRRYGGKPSASVSGCGALAGEGAAGQEQAGEQAGATGGKAERGGTAATAARPSFFEDPLRYLSLLFSGAASAVVSRTCVAPLERVKMELLLRSGTLAAPACALATALQVLRSEGLGGFWRGNALNVLRTAPFKAVNFLSFDAYHAALAALAGSDGNAARFAAGACAGVTATLVCFPLDVVRTRLMAAAGGGGGVAGPRYGSGPFATLAGILRHEGAAALYTGCLPAVIGMAPAGAVFYGVYDMLKHQHAVRSRAAVAANDGEAEAGAAGGEVAAAAAHQPLAVDPVYTLLYGAVAGAASELIVYPLEVVRRKMQLQSMAAAAAGTEVATTAAAMTAAAAPLPGELQAEGGSGAGKPSPPTHRAPQQAPHQHANAGAAAVPTAKPAAAAAAGPSAPAPPAAAGRRLAATPLQPSHLPRLSPPGTAATAGAAAQRAAAAALSSAAASRSPSLARMAAAVAAILRLHGPRGFYSGLLPNMLQVLPSSALSYYTYDTLKTALGVQ